MKQLLFLLVVGHGLHAMEEEHTYTLTVHETHSKHVSHEEDKTGKAFLYFLGTASPHINRSMSHLLKQKIQQSKIHDEDLWQTIERINPNDKLSDSQELDLRLRELKRLVAACVDESLRQKEEETLEAQLQLKLRDKDVRIERYKFYAALVGAGGTLVASIVTIITMATL